MKDGEPMLDSNDEATIARLLEAAGPRPVPSAEAMAAARAAVASGWREAVAVRQRRRRYTAWSVAAAVPLAAVAVWLALPSPQPAPATVAALLRVEGEVQRPAAGGGWTPVAAGDSVEAGTELRTAAGGRAALRLSNGVELRLDAGTHLALGNTGRARLEQGAVYVDSGAQPGPASRDLVLETPAGSVRHLGTQYLARLDGVRLTVGVREGRVALEGRSATAVGGAGEQLTVEGGRLVRAPLSRSAAEWQWIADVTPPFRLDGRTVEEFLVWAARETGRSIVYTSPEAGRQARSVTLSGTVEGLAPEAAVKAVLSTTSLRPEIGAEHIRVEVQSR